MSNVVRPPTLTDGFNLVVDALQLNDLSTIYDAKYGEEIAAAVVLKPGETASEGELEHYALTKLSAFEVPKRFYFVRELPRTAKGAGDRHKLAAMFAGATSERTTAIR